MSGEWNHNIAYHDLVLSTVPHPCGNALDVGCGDGRLAQRLAEVCGQVTGIDLVPVPSADVDKPESSQTRVSIVAGDVMTYPFPPESFAFLSSIATLHHLSLGTALIRFRDLLSPGGVLIVVGLYRRDTLADAIFEAMGLAVSWCVRWNRNFEEIAAPTQPPHQTIAEIRRSAQQLLPGSLFKRRLFFRYSLIWHKPEKVVR